MKKTITKIWSIGLIVTLLAGLLIAATAAPVSAGTLVFSTQGIPATIFNQILAGSDTALIKQASNGHIFAVDTAGILSGVPAIYRSADGGRTWTTGATATVAQFPAGTAIVDIEISPAYEIDNRVFALGNNAGVGQVYVSVNGGLNFNVLGGQLPTGAGTSLAVSPTYSAGVGEIMAGTTTGEIYMWDRLGVQNWAPQTPGAANVLDVDFSPNYPIDATIMAVTANATHTRVQSRVASLLWDSLGGPPNILAAVATAADLAVPGDFNASLQFNRAVYVSVAGTAADGVYRTAVGATTPPAPPQILAGTFTSIDYNGTQAAGTLLAGSAATTTIWRSTNAYPLAPPATITFLPSAPSPTGAGTTYVLMANDFASSSRVYAGTAGNPESALSISDDGGATFYQAGMIDTAITNIQDFQPASADEIFLVTANGAGPESVWRSLDGGASWYRVLAFATQNGAAIVRLSPDYATDSTLYFAETGAAADDIRLSNDGGTSWVARIGPATSTGITDLVVKDQYTIYVGTFGGTVVSSVNGGFFWGVASTVSAQVTDLKYDVSTGHLLVGCTNRVVQVSKDNLVTWSNMGALATAGGVDAPVVAFDADYANNDTIYAIDAGGNAADAGVFRRTTAPTDAFTGIAPLPAAGPPVVAGVALPGDILVAPDGSLYVTDQAVAGAAAGGLWRSISPTLPAIPGTFGVAASWQEITGTGSGLTLGTDVLTGLSMTEGSNILYAINNAGVPGPNVRTYTDTLSLAIPTLLSPEDGVVNPSPTAANLMWQAVTGARAYHVQLDTRADFATASTGVGNPTGITAVVAAPLVNTVQATVAGRTYYWRVRVSSPVFGPWSQSMTFLTELAPGAPNAPLPTGPVAGGTNAGGYDAPLNPTFQWGNVPFATGYEFQLATDPLMEELIVDFSGDKPLGNSTAYKLTAVTLDYSTTYYWRVRGISATTQTDWCPVTAFTTMAEPTAPPTQTQPPATSIVVTQPPQTSIVVTQPPATTITVAPPEEETVSPAYIWAIIIIGAVLVIAVIVLIVRTRRNV